MYRTLAQSRVTLNMHVDVGRANNAGGNMRLYEATGCGALVISDFAPDVPEIFQPGREIVTYRTISELNEKVHYYRDHRAEAEGIARAGQIACWQRHGYERRIREFEAIIKRYAAS
jgi:spore maturation protein CgeB